MNRSRYNILAVVSEAAHFKALLDAAEKTSSQISFADSLESARKLLLSGADFSCAFFELVLDYSDSGLVLAYEFSKSHPSSRCTILTGEELPRELTLSLSERGAAKWIHAQSIIEGGLPPDELEARMISFIRFP